MHPRRFSESFILIQMKSCFCFYDFIIYYFLETKKKKVTFPFERCSPQRFLWILQKCVHIVHIIIMTDIIIITITDISPILYCVLLMLFFPARVVKLHILKRRLTVFRLSRLFRGDKIHASFTMSLLAFLHWYKFSNRKYVPLCDSKKNPKCTVFPLVSIEFDAKGVNQSIFLGSHFRVHSKQRGSLS